MVAGRVGEGARKAVQSEGGGVPNRQDSWGGGEVVVVDVVRGRFLGRARQSPEVRDPGPPPPRPRDGFYVVT